ncbi:MAG: mechanosensitive ion channel [Flavobacteriaceae bacterium]|nr:mechanosensitive ion channel [Flavobacteriaceae bacterium]
MWVFCFLWVHQALSENLIAGYSMIYRGAFRIGDYIEVEGQSGFVEVQELLVTRLRSIKNEEIIIT